MTRGLAVFALLCGCATWTPQIPDRLKPPPDLELRLEAQAVGAQIYRCAATPDDPARYAWLLRQPEGQLFDEAGRRIGAHHGATWEASDGSRFVAENVAAEVEAPDAGAVSWFLVEGRATSNRGCLGQIKAIQRLQTIRGRPPATGCDAARAGAEVSVPYRATFTFYAPRGAPSASCAPGATIDRTVSGQS
jgi:hypothetical protein